jgi:diguanylate cyclase (GGDEF)-like protein
LFEAADQVAFYANEFAQDKAVEQANDYAYVANGIERLIKSYRDLRLEEAREAISFVTATARSLAVWVLMSAFAAIVLIGPIGLTTMHRVLSRLGRITHAMTRLARHDTTAVIPSSDDGDEVGAMARAVEVFKDNAIQLIAREVELKQLNRRIDIALNNMTHGLCMFDAEQKLIVCNKTYVQMYGLTPALSKPGTLLQTIENYRASIGNGALANPEQMAAATAIQAREASAFTQELMDGRIVAVSQRPMQDGGHVAVHEDITERRRAEAKIAHLARHDMLTNLPNRVLFREHLEGAFQRIQPGRGFAVHCLDLDHFKTVNDTLGHPIGDELLKLVAARLIEAVPATDFMARIGGDEFAVVQTNVSRPEQCSQLASRIVEMVSQPYDIDGRHIVIGTSIGIAMAPNDGGNPDLLLKNADMALYLAKGDGRGTHRFFEREMDKRLQTRRALELDLRKAIANGEFEVYYQPILYLQTGRVSGFEALVRWNHPERGMISPGDFIPLAEETGLILPLGEWVLRTACTQAARWPAPVGVAVNLSATQFKGRNVVQLTLNALAASGLPASRLDLEITESVLLQDEAHTLALLHQLREIGVQISMDDFGTGYSSLAYLRNFPFDKIKIDRSFVREMLVRQDCRAIVRAVVGLARSLGITTIIEGIETKEQLAGAKADGCDEGQGFLFAKPMPEREVAAFLAKCERMAAAA